MILPSVLQQIIHPIVAARAHVTLEPDAVMGFRMTRVISFLNIQGFACEHRSAPRDLTPTEKRHLIRLRDFCGRGL